MVEIARGGRRDARLRTISHPEVKGDLPPWRAVTGKGSKLGEGLLLRHLSGYILKRDLTSILIAPFPFGFVRIIRLISCQMGVISRALASIQPSDRLDGAI